MHVMRKSKQGHSGSSIDFDHARGSSSRRTMRLDPAFVLSQRRRRLLAGIFAPADCPGEALNPATLETN